MNHTLCRFGYKGISWAGYMGFQLLADVDGFDGLLVIFAGCFNLIYPSCFKFSLNNKKKIKIKRKRYTTI
jgi:hypothetical protein